MDKQTQRGFTIYELLITLLIVGIVLTLGIPNLSSFTQNSRITSTVNDLHSSFMIGRSEAARSKSNITICASANPLAANANCDGASFDGGWIVFVDVNGDLNRAGVNEPLLRQVPPIPDKIDITVNDGSTYFSFAPTGLGRGDVAGPAFQTAFICDERGNELAAGGYSAARRLVVTPIGRSTVLREVGQIDDAGGCP